MTQTILPNEPHDVEAAPEAAQPGLDSESAGAENASFAVALGSGGVRPAERLREPWMRLAALVALGGVSGFAYYLGFVRPYLLSAYYTKPLRDLAKISGYTGISANEWALTWIVLFACYYWAFRICPPAERVTQLFRRVAVGLIAAWALFFAANLVFMYPVGAADLFDQIFRARLTAHYGYNPFTTLPSSIVGDPFQQYVAWQGDPSPYGPVWETLAAGVSFVAGGSLWANLIEFKLLVIAAYALGVWLTYMILKTVRPDWALRGTLLFAWNPLVQFEVGGNGHNDALVMLFILAAIFFIVKMRRLAVLPALAAGVLTKFVPALLVPVALVALWRDRMKRAKDGTAHSIAASAVLSSIAISTVLAIGLAAILYAPFWTGPESILPRNRETLFTASIGKVVLDYLTNDAGVSSGWAQWAVRNGAYAIVALVTLGLTFWVWRTPNATTPEGRALLLRRMLIAFYEIIFTYMMVASLWFQPWYLLWLVALTAPVAAVTGRNGVTYVNRTLLFCIGGVLNYFVWDFIWLWNQTEFRNIQITSAIAVYTLPLVYTLYVWFGRPPGDEIPDATIDNSELQAATTT